jgi:hypothetical protein
MVEIEEEHLFAKEHLSLFFYDYREERKSFCYLESQRFF